MRFIKTIGMLTGAVITLAMCGCATSVLESEFGDSVRQMTRAQTADMNATLNPDPDAVQGSDPDMLNNVVNTHREHISRPEDVSGDIVIRVGN